MPRIIITAQVEDSDKWLQTFKTHGDLFRELGVTASHYTATEDNEIALYQEVEDLEKFFAVLKSPATAAAMVEDGVKRETVKVYALDEESRAQAKQPGVE